MATEIPFVLRRRRFAMGDGRFSRGFMATARAGWVAVKVLTYASLGVGAAVGGAAIVASGANILTSSDKVLLVMGTAAPSSDRSEYPGRDPFSTRSAPQPPPTPEESLHLTRTEALFTFGMGLFVAVFSLVGFAAAWGEAAEALAFGGGGGGEEKKKPE